MQPRYTRRSNPPTRNPNARRSKYIDVFAEARTHPGEWHQVLIHLARDTIIQYTSDINSAHRRHPDKRFTGIKDGEHWQAQWADLDDHTGLWIRLTPTHTN